MKKCSPSLIIKEIQIKTKLKFHLTPVKIPPINVSKDEGRKGTLIHCWWECKLVQPLWKTMWKLLKKLSIHLP
jgi:hypothetical protein